MLFRFWALLALVPLARNMHNPFELGPLPSSFLEADVIADSDWDLNDFATHHLTLPLSEISPSVGHNPLPSTPAAFPEYKPEALIIPHQLLDYTHLDHKPSQSTLDHLDLSENRAISKIIGPQHEHPSPSSLSGPTANTRIGLHCDSPLRSIHDKSSWPTPVDSHQTEASSNFLHPGHPLDSIVVNQKHDGLVTNDHLIRANLEHNPPTAKRKLKTQGATFLRSERAAKKISLIENVGSVRVNPEPTLHTYNIPNIFPRSPDSFFHKFDYQLIDFEPLTADGLIVMQAIQNLKIPNGTKFFNIPTSSTPSDIHSQNQAYPRDNEQPVIYKLFCLRPSTEGRVEVFYNFFQSFRRDKEFKGVTRSVIQNQQVRYHEARRALTNFSLMRNDRQSSIISNYKQFVLSDFANSISNLKDTVERCFADPKFNRRLRFYHTLSQLFPLYLCYVDMINAIEPAGHIDREARFLQAPRRKAGEIFFEVIDKTLSFQKEGPKPQCRKAEIIYSLTQMYEVQVFSKLFVRYGIVWKFLEYWILTSRIDLTKYECNVFPTSRFKDFYNSMVFDLSNQP